MVSVTTLKKAVEVAEKIDALEAELKQLLVETNGSLKNEAPTIRRAKKRKVANGNGNEQGLAHAVREILVKAGKSLRVAEIMDELQSQNYPFQSKNPKRSLGAQIYNLRGVKKAGRGLFKAAV